MVSKVLELAVEGLDEDYFFEEFVSLDVEVEVDLRKVHYRIASLFLIIGIKCINQHIIRSDPLLHPLRLVLRIHIQNQLKTRVKLSQPPQSPPPEQKGHILISTHLFEKHLFVEIANQPVEAETDDRTVHELHSALEVNSLRVSVKFWGRRKHEHLLEL